MKKTNGIILLCIVLIVGLATLYSWNPVKAAANVVIISQRGFLTTQEATNLYSVVGEVQNTGDIPASNTSLTATFYNSQNIPLNFSTGKSFIDCLLPGQKSPFRLALSGTNALSVASYSLSSPVFNEFPQGKPTELKILNSTYYASLTDRYVKNLGIIKNNGTRPATAAQVVVTFYYKTNSSVFWATRSITQSANLTQGQTTKFETSSQPLIFSPQTINVVLVAESKEYLSSAFTNAFQDTILPDIGKPEYNTAYPIVGVNVTVTKPDYASKVTQVQLWFRSGTTLRHKDMIGPSTGNKYGNYIDAFPTGQTVLFWMNATDDAGNRKISDTYTYTAKGNPAPGVPVEVLIIILIVIIVIAVIVRYRKKIF